MGSCAGAGSGEFHAFRKSRRREYARQSILRYRQIRDEKDAEFRDKVDTQQKVAEDKTAKKRAKRQKEKERLKKMRKMKGKEDEEKKDSDESSEESEEEENEKGEGIKVPADPYDDPLMQHPEPKIALVIPGNFSVQ